MLPESIESLHHLLSEQGIKVLLAGGWAVNEHGYTRQTVDVDWVICEEQEQQVNALMASLQFEAGSKSKLVTRFFPRTLTLPVVDFLWVDSSTFSKLSTSDTFGGRHNSIPLLRLDHLIAMKIHALKDHEQRKGRDLLDIRYLLDANPGVVSEDTLRKLCSRHGPPGAYELIRRP